MPRAAAMPHARARQSAPLLSRDLAAAKSGRLRGAGRKHQLRRHMALLGHPVLGDQQYSYGYAKQVARSLQPFPGQTPRAIALARLGRDAEMGAGRWWAAVEEDGDALPARIRAAKAAEAAAAAAAERRRADSEADAAYHASDERGAGQSVRQRVRDMLHGEGAGSDGWEDENEAFMYPSGLTAAQLDPDPDAFSGTTAVQRLRNDRSSSLRSGRRWPLPPTTRAPRPPAASRRRPRGCACGRWALRSRTRSRASWSRWTCRSRRRSRSRARARCSPGARASWSSAGSTGTSRTWSWAMCRWVAERRCCSCSAPAALAARAHDAKAGRC